MYSASYVWVDWVGSLEDLADSLEEMGVRVAGFPSSCRGWTPYSPETKVLEGSRDTEDSATAQTRRQAEGVGAVEEEGEAGSMSLSCDCLWEYLFIALRE